MRWWDIDDVVALERELFPGDSPWTPGMFWAELAVGHHYVVHRGAAAHRADADGPDAEVRDAEERDAEGRDAKERNAEARNTGARNTGGRDAEAIDAASTVLGYAGLAIGPDTADVQTIGVAPAAQHRGIGRALLRDLLTAAGDLPVMLEVRTDNAPAIALYESEGFARVGIRRRYYQPSGADAFTMRRPPRPERLAHAGTAGSAGPTIGGRS